VVVADNLAAHGIGGFLESFSSTHPCRFCLISKDKLNSQLCRDPIALHTPATYASQVNRVTSDQSLQSVYGIKQNSCLNRIPFFNVTRGLPSDVMHDLLEGVVCDVTECDIKYFASSTVVPVT
jgi:hypothetical protein